MILGTDIYYQVVEQKASLWETEWFYRRIFLLVLLIISFLVYFRIRYLIKSREKKQEFIKKLIKIQEAGLKKVSFELHDSIGQNLLVINNDIIKITQNLKKEEPLKIQLTKITRMVLDSIEEIRRVSSGIYPHQIKKIGLKKAIEAMVNKLLDNFGIKSEVDICELDEVLKNESGLDLYRIIQEAMNNTVKHSGAKKVTLKVCITGKYIQTEIEDDGKGFDFRKLKENNAGGFGLFNMSERTKATGGKFNIESEPGKGTRIKILIPRTINHH